ncbi:MAG: hypothetical protein KC635_28445 [Myxococcales bacterium]|nr:hypothetical protein [Myxococcales bacterium]
MADATELAPGPCPPPADATCLAVYLTPFRAGNPPLLVPGVRYTVRLDKSFPDLDGHENATDIVISFTTAEEGVVRVLGPADETVRGLDYDPGSRALFYAAVDGATNRDAVYKMPIVDGLVGFAALFTRLGDGVQRFGGLDVLDSKLWLSLTGIGRVWVFDGLGGEAGVFSREIHLTTLDAPYDSLIQVTSVAAVGAGARLLFAFGHYFGIDRPAGLIELTDGPTPTWSIFGAGAFSTEGSFAVAAPAAPSDDVVYVASEDEIVALSAATGARLGAVPYSSVDAKLRVDSRGRLWAAGGLELTVFAPAETGVFTVIKRGLGPTNELALVERGNQVVVYWTKVWDTRELRRTVFTFCDDGEVSCTPSCEDGEQDYDETGVDCGGGCDRCDVGGGCESARDCLSGICGDGVCREDTGCADGTREGFVDIAPFPDIAGCSGAWSVPGVVTAAAPACGRRAGDDGELPSGAGCNVADLCAEGWHVCADFGDVADATSFGGCEGAVTTSEPLFFVTRQGSLGNAACPLFGGGANDLFGCGSLGNAPGAGCAPLDRTSGDLCLALGPPWACGADAANEANNVTKTGSDAGGVLCCRGPQ